MTTEPGKLDVAVVTELYARHALKLERFLTGLLGDRERARDVVQIAFTRLVEQGDVVRADARKAWLYQVAYREALAMRRRDAVTGRVLREIAQTAARTMLSADSSLLRREAVDAVRQAIDRLPMEQRAVVRQRIYAGKTFAEIARELEIPLGTALGRMRAAVEKLRLALRDLD